MAISSLDNYINAGFVRNFRAFSRELNKELETALRVFELLHHVQGTTVSGVYIVMNTNYIQTVVIFTKRRRRCFSIEVVLKRISIVYCFVPVHECCKLKV